MRTPAHRRSYFPFWRVGRNKGAKPTSALIWISAARYWPAPAATIRSLHAAVGAYPRVARVGLVRWLSRVGLQAACFVAIAGSRRWSASWQGRFFGVF